ncbi:MAG: energy transducer TonB [Methylacidiphilales bacterium]|nr:energy transducer TonB [Candidatus Methylacidiphilales bacterium]
MHRINFIHQPRADVDPAHTRRAFLASLLIHALALGAIIGLGLIYRFDLPKKSGSAPGASSITLETMVVVPSPPQPPVPQPQKPTTELAAQPPTVTSVAPSPKPPPPEAKVPVLAIQPSKPIQPAPAKTRVTVHPATSHATTATAQSHPKPAAASALSSYSPGINSLQHPPYPAEARDHGQTGTVIVNVVFDAEGNVAYAEVAQSSGVPILDSETRSFIREHWHSAEYAGQTIRQPVRYSLEN